jgi:beta-glucosidase/6-phospho-beta-glucosidase/beta-galactosidase
MSKAEYDAWYDQAFSSLLSYLTDSGAGYARVFIAWSDIEPNQPLPGQPPVYDQYWLQWYDARLAQIAQAGIKIIVTMGFTPSWAGDGDGASCPAIFPDHIAHYQQFLTFLVTRYSQPPTTSSTGKSSMRLTTPIRAIRMPVWAKRGRL